MKAAGTDLLPIDHRILWCPDAWQSAPRMFDDLHGRAKRRLDPLDEAALLVPALGPDELEARKAVLEWFEQAFSTVLILDVGLMHQHVEDQPIGIHEQMPLAAFDLLAPIVAAGPPISLVFTD